MQCSRDYDDDTANGGGERRVSSSKGELKMRDAKAKVKSEEGN